MPRLYALLAALALAFVSLQATAPAAHAQDAIFPYDYEVRDYDNGLRAIVVPTPYPNIVNLQIAVGTGSRDEVEEGRSGFAHFFEHMMFRGSENYTSDERGELLKNMGADDNAYTTDDRTVYHATIQAEDLGQLLTLEADRFQRLQYSEPDFRTEALAVLGEYNKNSANPISKLFEVQRAAAFTQHTYGHTTMGYIEDIEAMPEGFDYAQTFFDRFYRPENTTIIVSGDVDPEAVFAMIAEEWAGWEPGYVAPEVPVEPEPTEAVYAHVEWPAATIPWVTVGFHGPAAFTTEGPTAGDMQALDVANAYAFGSTSPLYQQLVIQEQKVDQLFGYFPDSRDPGLVTVMARVRDIADIPYVREQIQRAFAELRARPVNEDRLDAIKSALRYGFAQGLDNSEAIADALVPYVAATRDPETINRIYRFYTQVDAADIRNVAERYFQDDRMVVTTLSHENLPDEARQTGSVDALVQVLQDEPYETEEAVLLEEGEVMEEVIDDAMEAVDDAMEEMGEEMGEMEGSIDDMETTGPVRVTDTLPGGNEPAFDEHMALSQSPLVNFRFRFATGPADDPEGKEGLATLTALMVTQAGSRALEYAEVQRRLYPFAAGFGASVDKEMTVFQGQTHRDNLQDYYDIISGMLLDPGFRESDFTRVRRNLVNQIRIGLRANNDEELGKEVLYEMIYAGHPYGHLNAGHVGAVEALTLDDVRAFYQEHYTQSNLTLAIAGGATEAFVNRVRDDLANHLPSGTPMDDDAATDMLPAPAYLQGRHVALVQKDTRATAISFGFPIDVVRGDPDWPALYLVRSFLGEHRNSNSFLYQRIREARGMNYGDYAYIEYFPNGMFLTQPAPGTARSQQIFQVWIRPVPPEQAHFALRTAVYEVENLYERGLTEAQFEATRNFLSKYTSLLVASQGRQQGYALDSDFYGTDEFVSYVRESLQSLTLEDVNAAIRRHLDPADMAIVMIAPNAEELATALATDAPSPIEYASEKPAELLAEDEVIQAYPLGIEMDNIRVIPVEEVFEDAVFE